MDVRPGRDEELSRLFEVHYADTVRLAFYLTGSWAVGEDLAQEAFVRLWRRWGRLRDHHAALGYLRVTVVNLSRSALRRRLLELRHQRTIGHEGTTATWSPGWTSPGRWRRCRRASAPVWSCGTWSTSR
jgi:DNA-directed RNA polymerase specialized sigma24 family protein